MKYKLILNDEDCEKLQVDICDHDDGAYSLTINGIAVATVYVTEQNKLRLAVKTGTSKEPNYDITRVVE